MRLSTVVELLLILLLVAFAAYGRVIDSGLVAVNRSIRASNVPKQSIELPIITETTENVNKYCTCSDVICNCCRNFHIPLVQLKGPGCASLQYLKDDNLAVQLSFGDNILTSTIVNGKNPKPVCVPLPGGFSKFCGRVYSIKRDADNHFKACLGLELQSSTELEASLRVSCFRFGPDGLKLRPAEPFPIVESEQTSEEDDDDDLFGLGSDDDDDDDDDEDDAVRPSLNAVSDNIGTNVGSVDEEEDEEDDDDDVLGFGALLDIITGDDETATKKPKATTAAPLLQFTIPILTRPTTASSDLSTEESLAGVNDALTFETLDSQNDNHQEDYGQELNDIGEQVNNENQDGITEADLLTDLTTNESVVETNQNGETNKPVKLLKPTGNHKIKKIGTGNNKKPSITTSSINAINDDIKKKNKKKPVKKPIEDEDEDDDVLDDEDDDDDDLDDIDDDEDDDDDDDDDDDLNENDHGQDVDPDEDDEKTDDLDDLDDDDDEEEDAVLSALVEDDKPKIKKNKIVTNKGQSSRPDEEDDYSIGITDFLARKKQDGRQSRIMRL